MVNVAISLIMEKIASFWISFVVSTVLTVIFGESMKFIIISIIFF